MRRVCTLGQNEPTPRQALQNMAGQGDSDGTFTVGSRVRGFWRTAHSLTVGQTFDRKSTTDVLDRSQVVPNVKE
jgi:hypothetical protein